MLQLPITPEGQTAQDHYKAIFDKLEPADKMLVNGFQTILQQVMEAPTFQAMSQNFRFLNNEHEHPRHHALSQLATKMWVGTRAQFATEFERHLAGLEDAQQLHRDELDILEHEALTLIKSVWGWELTQDERDPSNAMKDRIQNKYFLEAAEKCKELRACTKPDEIEKLVHELHTCVGDQIRQDMYLLALRMYIPAARWDGLAFLMRNLKKPKTADQIDFIELHVTSKADRKDAAPFHREQAQLSPEILATGFAGSPFDPHPGPVGGKSTLAEDHGATLSPATRAQYTQYSQGHDVSGHRNTSAQQDPTLTPGIAAQMAQMSFAHHNVGSYGHPVGTPQGSVPASARSVATPNSLRGRASLSAPQHPTTYGGTPMKDMKPFMQEMLKPPKLLIPARSSLQPQLVVPIPAAARNRAAGENRERRRGATLAGLLKQWQK